MAANQILAVENASKKTWDAIVVGAGTGGLTFAKKFAESGLEPLIIEKKGLNQIGRKVCGDAIGSHHFKRTNIAIPNGEELEGVYKGIRVYSPSLETFYVVRGIGYSINRYLFGQRLLNEALTSGAKLLPETSVKDVFMQESSVKGVVVKSSTGKTFIIKGALIIEASGWTGVLRRRVAHLMNIEKHFSKNDLAYCYREIRRLHQKYGDGSYADIFLSREIAPGGYWWVFPKKEGLYVNVGLGVQMSTKADPVKLFEKILSKKFMIKSKLIEGRTGIVPTRRPVNNMVWNGLIIIGDAAAHANPLHGGGIGHSMFAGKLAAEIGAKAVKEGDVSVDRLWEFNVKYMRMDGARNAKLDVFRIFLQKISDVEIEFGMKARLIDESRLSALDIERKDKGLKQKLEKVVKSLKKPSLLRKLLYVKKVMGKVRHLYENYPEERVKFMDWSSKVNEVFRKYIQDLGK